MQYEGWVNPYGASLADTIARSGDAQAHAAEMIAQANARAAEMKGAAWAGAATNIGRDIAAIPQQIAKQKTEQVQQQSAALDLTAKKRVEDARNTLASVMSDTPKLSEDGVSVWDTPAITRAMADKGFGPEAGAVAQHLEGINTAFRQTRAAQLAVVQRGAQAVAASGNDPTLAMHFLDQLEANNTYPKSQIDGYRTFIKADPANTAKLTSFLMGPQKGQVVPKDAIVINPITNQQTASNVVPEKPTEASLALEASGGDAAGAMDLLKPKPKLSIEEEWLARDRRLAVAKNGGQPLTDTQLKAVDTTSMQQYAESKADPAVREAALAQKNVALLLAQSQLNQVPTKEQAASVAEDLVNHRISPDQLTSLFSTRGREGLAFKLNVTSEAKKLDPAFNFEEAQSNYNLSKSTGFQNTVRYIDSALESIPRLEHNAQSLGNGSFRTLNQIANAAKNQFNSTDLKRFKTDALLVGDEVAKILSGGGTGSATSDAKLKQATDIIGQTDSVPAIAAAMEEVQALMGNRRRALTRGTYMEGTGAVAAPASGPAVGERRMFDGKLGEWDGKGWKSVQP